ncbi:hypothetical protein ACFXJ8_29735 [Nonomuraea sp. NPDC059194]|uniref:hypothetical protein n=1 Tax=Nonomuraea sp. NPDC059194 TaxID=3346764 RepID=UPI0036BE6466
MDSPEGRVVLIIVIAMVLFFVGKRFQQSLDTWRGWGKAVTEAANAAKNIPGARSKAWSAFWSMVLIGGGTLALLALIANAIQAE